MVNRGAAENLLCFFLEFDADHFSNEKICGADPPGSS